MKIKSIKIIVISGFVLLNVSLKAQQKIDGVAVVIGKNIVLESDVEKFKQEIKSRENQKKMSDCEILETIMTRKLLAHHGIIDSVKVNDSQIDATVERNLSYFKQQLGSVEKVLDFYGFDNENIFREELAKIEKENVLISEKQQQIMKTVNVTPEEVRTYFNSLKEKNNLPQFGAEIELSQIVIDINPKKEAVVKVIEKLKDIRKQVMEGASFKMKALIYSKDPSVVQNGGFFKISRDSPFVKEFKEVAFGLDEGEISEPFKTAFGYHIILLEKIKGGDLELRHILMDAEITDEQLLEYKTKISKIRDSILARDLIFEKAVVRYSDDEVTRENKGIVINAQTQNSKFELTRMDPILYGQINTLGVGEISEPYLEETREGKKMYKIFLIKNKQEARLADFIKDYVKIQNLALEKKRQEKLDQWYDQHIQDTYIKIGTSHKECNFKYNWFKKQQ